MNHDTRKRSGPNKEEEEEELGHDMSDLSSEEAVVSDEEELLGSSKFNQEMTERDKELLVLRHVRGALESLRGLTLSIATDVETAVQNRHTIAGKFVDMYW